MAYPPHKIDGVGRQVHLMAQGFHALGHTVHVIAHGNQETLSFYDGAWVHRLPFTLERYGRYQPYPRLHHTLNYSHAVYDRVQQLVKEANIQVVDSPLWQVDGLVTAVSRSLPVVVHLQTASKQISDIHHDRDTDSRLLGEMEESLLRYADHLVPNSQATWQAIQKVYGLNPSAANCTIVPIGILPFPEEVIRPFNPDAPPQTLTVLYVGRLEKRKGIQALFAAISTVWQQIPQVRFIIVGADNSLSDGFQARHGASYPDYFRRTYPHLTDRVQFTGGVSDTELQAYYQSCDLFVAPSLYESFGIIYLEAMNYAKPVIGCRAGGIPEVIDEGVTGLLAEPGDAATLAAAIVQLLQSPEQLRTMGLAGRQRLLQKFTHLQMARQSALVYQQLIRK
jgi:hypothetical protein